MNTEETFHFDANSTKEEIIGQLADGMRKYNAPQAPCCLTSRFDMPMSFRDFLCLKKEVLEEYQDYLDEMEDRSRYDHLTTQETAGDDVSSSLQILGYRRLKQGKSLIPSVQWPEALKGLTREDIEILKL